MNDPQLVVDTLKSTGLFFPFLDEENHQAYTIVNYEQWLQLNGTAYCVYVNGIGKLVWYHKDDIYYNRNLDFEDIFDELPDGFKDRLLFHLDILRNSIAPTAKIKVKLGEGK